jgi:hypothetical protein
MKAILITAFLVCSLLLQAQTVDLNLGGISECDDTTRFTKLVFKIAVSKEGKISEIELAEATGKVSRATIEKCEQELRNEKWLPADNVASKGKVSFCLPKEGASADGKPKK